MPPLNWALCKDLNCALTGCILHMLRGTLPAGATAPLRAYPVARTSVSSVRRTLHTLRRAAPWESAMQGLHLLSSRLRPGCASSPLPGGGSACTRAGRALCVLRGAPPPLLGGAGPGLGARGHGGGVGAAAAAGGGARGPARAGPGAAARATATGHRPLGPPGENSGCWGAAGPACTWLAQGSACWGRRDARLAKGAKWSARGAS